MSQRNPEVLAFLAARRSYPAKAMVAPAPSVEAVTELLRIAARVPDHGKLEPWRFVVLTRPALARLADLAEARARETGGDAERIAKGRGQFDRGLIAVAVIASPKASDKVPEIEQILSAGALCQNLLNAAQAAGWAANWITGWPAHDPVWGARALELGPQERVAGFVYLGSEGPDMPDRPRPDLRRLTKVAE